ncbi:MAG: ClpXP protease specificity-enhancing factor SspB [bacterium]
MIDEQLSKREALESLLKHGDVLLQLDPRVAGVGVPTEYVDQPLLVLRIGLEMPIPIPDLEISDAGIQATLSFRRTPHAVEVPWRAIFGMVSEHGQGLLWTGDVPREVLQQMLEAGAGGESGAMALDEGVDPQGPSSRPRLRAIDGGRRDASADVREGSPAPPAGGPPHLRVIK